MGLALKLGSVAPDFERRMLVLWMGEFVSTVACVTDSYIGFVGTAVEHSIVCAGRLQTIIPKHLIHSITSHALLLLQQPNSKVVKLQ